MKHLKEITVSSALAIARSRACLSSAVRFSTNFSEQRIVTPGQQTLKLFEDRITALDSQLDALVPHLPIEDTYVPLIEHLLKKSEDTGRHGTFENG